MSKATELIELFNNNVDFVRMVGDFKYEPMEGPKGATHHLIATRWNTRDQYKPNSKGKYVMIAGYAQSVVAEPMRVKLTRTGLVVRGKFPKARTAPVYRYQAELKGKLGVLRYLLEAMRPVGLPKLRRQMKHYDGDDCDRLYNNLIRASRMRIHQRAERRAKLNSRKKAA